MTADQLAPITAALHALRLDTTPQQYCGDDVDKIVTFHAATDTTCADVVLRTLGEALH